MGEGAPNSSSLVTSLLALLVQKYKYGRASEYSDLSARRRPCRRPRCSTYVFVQYLCVCTSKASKEATRQRHQGASIHTYLCCICTFVIVKASKLDSATLVPAYGSTSSAKVLQIRGGGSFKISTPTHCRRHTSGITVSICTFVPVNPLRQYLYFCTSKTSASVIVRLC